MRHTKIIATIGPASEKIEIIEAMISAGMNVARLNFSHGSHEEHLQRIKNIRAAAMNTAKPIGIMLDTKGPEIRTGKLETGKAMLKPGQNFVLTNRNIIGNESEVSISYAALVDDVSIDDNILLADGLISLQVTDKTATDIICKVVNGGELGDKKGVNLPGIAIDLPFLSAQDEQDILFGINNEVDFIAASFVNRAEDVLEIRRMLEKADSNINIIAKIESQQGVNNLESIIKVADGIMVARGDLGVEIPPEEVPLVQKQIVSSCCLEGKLVIIATQMLESMIQNPRPTRAEVSDVATAVFESADAIMLSGETAAGQYPVEVVETMARIAQRTEDALPYEEMLKKRQQGSYGSITDAISYACCATAMGLNISAIIGITYSGHTAKLLAKHRPQAAIIAATAQPSVINKMALVWGVYPVIIPETNNTDELFEYAISSSIESGYLEMGDRVVLCAGMPASISGATNMMKVHVIGEIIVQGMGIGSQPISGRVRIILKPGDLNKVEANDIAVTVAATPEFADYLHLFGAVIAEQGGLTSDAAIFGLNAGIPVVVGAKNATELLQDNMIVTIDTQRGIVYLGNAKIL